MTKPGQVNSGLKMMSRIQKAAPINMYKNGNTG